MRRIRAIARLACIVLVASGCGGGDVSDDDVSDDDDTSIEGEPDALAGITAAHNQLRAEVEVSPLRWNDDLEALAAGFVDDCEFAHSTQDQRSNVAGFAYVGESLAGGALDAGGAAVAESWASEKPNYRHDDSFDPSDCVGGECGHYTQMVWSATTDLGCALASCNGSAIVACEYGPGGNVLGQPVY